MAKADQYNLKASGAIEAFVAEAKKSKKPQLCVYQDQEKAVKHKQQFMEVLLYEIKEKKIRVLFAYELLIYIY